MCRFCPSDASTDVIIGQAPRRAGARASQSTAAEGSRPLRATGLIYFTPHFYNMNANIRLIRAAPAIKLIFLFSPARTRYRLPLVSNHFRRVIAHTRLCWQRVMYDKMSENNPDEQKLFWYLVT